MGISEHERTSGKHSSSPAHRVKWEQKVAPMNASPQDGCALECRSVTYRLPSGTALVSALNIKVAQGETLVLLGRSGSGKTTTLKLINRLLVPSEGEIFISGR